MAFDLDKELRLSAKKQKKEGVFDLDAELAGEQAPRVTRRPRRGKAPAGFIETTFAISVPSEDYEEFGLEDAAEASGFVHPDVPGLGVHKQKKMWGITHLASGKRIGTLDPADYLLPQSLVSLGEQQDWVMEQQELLVSSPSDFRPQSHFVPTPQKAASIEEAAQVEVGRVRHERLASSWAKSFSNTTAKSTLDAWTREVNKASRVRKPLPPQIGVVYTQDIPGWDQQFASSVRVAGFPYFFANPRSAGTPRNEDTYVHPGETLGEGARAPYFLIQKDPMSHKKSPRKLVLRGEARKAADRFFAALLSYWNKAAVAKGIRYWGPWTQVDLKGLSTEETARVRIATEYYSDSGAYIPRRFGRVFEWGGGLWVADTSQFWYGGHYRDSPYILEQLGITKPIHEKYPRYAELFEVVPKAAWKPMKKGRKWDLGDSTPYRPQGSATPFNWAGVSVRSDGKEYVRTGKTVFVPLPRISWDLRAADYEEGRVAMIGGKPFVVLGFRKRPGGTKRVGKDAYMKGNVDPTGIYVAPIQKNGRLGSPVFLDDLKAIFAGLASTEVDEGRLETAPWKGYRGTLHISDIHRVDQQIERTKRRISGVSRQEIDRELEPISPHQRWANRGYDWQRLAWRGVKKQQQEYKRWLEGIRKQLFAHVTPEVARMFKPTYAKPTKAHLESNTPSSIVVTYPISREFDRVKELVPDLYVRKY